MNLRTMSKYALPAFVVAGLVCWGSVGLRGKPADAATRKVIAYYFHGNIRCQSCITVEQYSSEAISEGFQTELRNGLLEYQVVNVDKPGNEHYFDDYQLKSWSLVLVEFRDGKQTKWRILDKVWDYVLKDQAHFHDYVKKEIKEFLGGEG